MNISKSYVKMRGEELYEHRHQSYIDATFAVAKRKPEKNSGLYSFQTLDLCNTGVALLQVYINEPF